MGSILWPRFGMFCSSLHLAGLFLAFVFEFEPDLIAVPPILYKS
jgi:hypothetical protein